MTGFGFAAERLIDEVGSVRRCDDMNVNPCLLRSRGRGWTGVSREGPQDRFRTATVSIPASLS